MISVRRTILLPYLLAVGVVFAALMLTADAQSGDDAVERDKVASVAQVESVDPAAGHDMAARILATRPAGSDSAGALFAVPLAVGLQLLVGWAFRRPWARRHTPRAVAFLVRPKFIALGSIIVADLIMLARPLFDGALTWEIALVAIGAHVGHVMSPTLNLSGAPDREVRETAAVPV